MLDGVAPPEAANEWVLPGRLDARPQATRRTYATTLADFAEYLARRGVLEASTGSPIKDVECFITTASEAKVTLEATQYLEWMFELVEVDGALRPRKAPGTVKNRLAGIRFAIASLARSGRIGWRELRVELPGATKDEDGRIIEHPGRDMRGPPEEIVTEILAAVQAGAHLRNVRPLDREILVARDKAILSLVAIEALRRSEVRAIDRADLDLGTRLLRVHGKGRRKTETIGLSAATARALQEWLDRRLDTEENALFLGSDSHRRIAHRRIGKNVVARVVARVADTCGAYQTSPHRLRHASITAAEFRREKMGLPLHVGMRRARHRSLAVHQGYFDARLDQEQRLSDAVGDALAPW